MNILRVSTVDVGIQCELREYPSPEQRTTDEAIQCDQMDVSPRVSTSEASFQPYLKHNGCNNLRARKNMAEVK
jgi:hypothetical protein